MAVTDSIADYLTRIRNAQQAGHRVVEIPLSKTKKRITEILYEQGYIAKYKVEEEAGKHGTLSIAIKYDRNSGEPIIKKMGRISKPGLRKYAGATEIPRIINGLGIAIVSTSKGLMTGRQAKRENVGGEVLCYIY